MKTAVRSVLFALSVLCGFVSPLAADDRPALSELTPRAAEAIDRGLARLADLQVAQVGNFGKSYKVASTALAGLAFVASGDQFGRGRHAAQIEGAVRYLLSDSVKKSILGKPGYCYFSDDAGQGKMHANGFAILFLAEVYGHTSRDAEIKRVLRGAVEAMLDAQTDLGGWGYHLRHEAQWGDDEASVTITQIQALRAARNAGIFVPAGAVARAVGYVKRSMTAEGACRYSLTMGAAAERNRTSFELTAAAVSTLNASGVYLGAGDGSTELERGIAYLRKKMREYRNPAAASTDFYYYGNFYAAQAMFQAEEADWSFWYPLARQELLDKQRPGGGWESPRGFGEAYATASALLILQMPRRYLPILQR